MDNRQKMFDQVFSAIVILILATMLMGSAALIGVTFIRPVLGESNAQAQPSLSTRRIVVDHTSLSLFSQIPDEWLTAARAIRVVFYDKSVGLNISSGLTTLAGTNPRYNRDNWDYHEWPASGCGGWADIVGCFYSQAGPAVAQYDVLGFGMSYLEVATGSGIGEYWTDTANLQEHSDYEAFFTPHPGKLLLHMTSSLSRDFGSAEAQAFNQAMREHVDANGGPLFDVADIESYSPTGAPCYDNRDGVYEYQPGTSPLKEENFPDDHQDVPAICGPKAPGGGYTIEVRGGHLNSMGKLRLAQAFWVLMAQIAGWVPEQTQATATVAATFTPIPATVSPLPTPTPTEEPTVIFITPTPEPTETGTAVPSATPQPTASATATPVASATMLPTATGTASVTPLPPTASPTATPLPSLTPQVTLTVTPVACPLDMRSSATVAAALQLWLEVWPSAQRYRDASNGSGSIEPLTPEEVSALIAACWTQANVTGARFYK